MVSPNAASRSDAKANRRKILEVARAAFAEAGDASLNSIAKQAGVGPGTLYRHFPTREDLVLAVYRQDVDELVATAPDLLSEHAPLEALRLWFERLAYYGRMKYGVAEVLHAATSDGLAGETYGPVIGALNHLLAACVAAGDVAADVRGDDVLLILGFLWRIDPSRGGEEQASRLLDLIIGGLRWPTVAE